MVFEGVYVAVITPFTQTGEVDLPTFKRHLIRLAGAGVQGFVPCGTTGESATLENSEWKTLVDATLEIARPRGLKVIPGCGGNNTAAVSKRLKECAQLKVDAVLSVTPYYNRPTPQGLVAHYRFLADHSEVPILLYHVPSRTNVNFPVATILSLFEHEKIIGIKEASGDYRRWILLGSKMDLNKKSLLAGDDEGFATILSNGGQGIISASANVIPKHFVRIYESFKSGNSAQAFKLQKEIYPLIETLFLETNPAPIKALLNRLGHCEDLLRLPLVSVGLETRERLFAALEQVETLNDL